MKCGKTPVDDVAWCDLERGHEGLCHDSSSAPGRTFRWKFSYEDNPEADESEIEVLKIDPASK